MAKKRSQKKPQQTQLQPRLINTSRPIYFFIPLISVLLAFAFLYKSLNYGFTNFDDPQLLVNNQIVKAFDIKRMFTEYIYKDYLPLTFLTYAIEYSFVKLDPFLYHLDNIILHLMNIILIFVFISLLSKKNFFLAGFCSFLFAIFPTQPESVVWLSERKDVLSTFFILLVYISYILFHKYKSQSYKAWGFYALSLLFLLLSLFAKAAGVTTAFILLCIDYYQDRSFTKKIILEKIPHLIIGLFFVYIHIVSHEVSGEQATTSFQPLYRLYVGVESLMFYISRSVFPLNLSPYYEALSYDKPIAIYLLGVIVFCLLFFFAGEKIHKRKEIFFGVGFFIFFILPVLNIVPLRGSLIYADRYLYLSGIGLFFAYGAIIQTWLEKWESQTKRAMLVVSLVSLSSYYLYMFNDRIQIWQSSFTLWADIVESNPRSVVGQMQLAHAYLDAGDVKSAVSHAEIGRQLNPENLEVNYSLSLIYYKNKQIDESLKHIEFILNKNPQHAKALSVKALVMKNIGNLSQAQALINQALQLQPNDYTVQKHAEQL